MQSFTAVAVFTRVTPTKARHASVSSERWHNSNLYVIGIAFPTTFEKFNARNCFVYKVQLT
jgi:hypothetical protein